MAAKCQCRTRTTTARHDDRLQSFHPSTRSTLDYQSTSQAGSWMCVSTLPLQDWLACALFAQPSIADIFFFDHVRHCVVCFQPFFSWSDCTSSGVPVVCSRQYTFACQFSDSFPINVRATSKQILPFSDSNRAKMMSIEKKPPCRSIGAGSVFSSCSLQCLLQVSFAHDSL